MEALLAKLGHPERRLPPVVHVAGTNGKGSTCAFLRAIGEAAGQRVHVYTSPHLVRFHERIRLAGEYVTDEALTATLEEVEAVNAGAPITVFEVTTAARLDATNVVPRPVATAITSISMDHMDFLGDALGKIAAEKAGIMRAGVPCVTGAQAPEALAVINATAAECAAPLLRRGQDWCCEVTAQGLAFRDAQGALALPPPGLIGPHQADNAGIAIAALRAAQLPWLNDAAIARGVANASWPARLQRLEGRLAALLPPGFSLWLDGGHNAGAGVALAQHFAAWRDQPLHLVIGMKQGKASVEFLRPLLPFATTIHAVAEPGQHLAMSVADIIAASGGIATPGPTVAEALGKIAANAKPGRALIAGSLYLAGEVLKANTP
ncbi:MAG: bifunctional folylpolyglutamate synthase/dihydrofolate synthase [Acetobacteraceae bacterium]|nr:bifunctional folylpolyglutamate synthase/dihydrofolate synthase [Acetobacteraceae bacterium]